MNARQNAEDEPRAWLQGRPLLRMGLAGKAGRQWRYMPAITGGSFNKMAAATSGGTPGNLSAAKVKRRMAGFVARASRVFVETLGPNAKDIYGNSVRWEITEPGTMP